MPAIHVPLLEDRDIISTQTLTREDIELVLDFATQLKASPQPQLLSGKLMASCFFEPSTRTRLSFESAMLRLGGQFIGFSETETTSAAKGESLSDAIRVIEQYVDVIVLRHPCAGAAQLAADVCEKPVINAGDGSNQHPTQTLTDLFSFKEACGSLDGLHLALAGDLCHGRTAHSLAIACAHFNCRLYFVCAEGLEMPQDICYQLRHQGVKFSFHRSLADVVPRLDVLYMTRIQQERLTKVASKEDLEPSCILSPELLEEAAPSMKIFHPLPRLKEIPPSIDHTPHAYYFQQAGNGLYVRQALLALLLGRLG